MSSDIESTRELEQITVKSDTRDVLAHSAKEVERKGFDKFLIVDIDAHVTETAFWSEIVDRIDSDVYQQMAKSFQDRVGSPPGLMNSPSADRRRNRSDRRFRTKTRSR